MDVAPVVIVWTVLLPRLQDEDILDHLLVQSVEDIMSDQIFDRHQSVPMEAADCNLQVLRGQLREFELGLGWADRDRMAGESPASLGSNMSGLAVVHLGKMVT